MRKWIKGVLVVYAFTAILFLSIRICCNYHGINLSLLLILMCTIGGYIVQRITEFGGRKEGHFRQLYLFFSAMPFIGVPALASMLDHNGATFFLAASFIVAEVYLALEPYFRRG